MPGPFHIELAFFKAIGKIVEDSVGPEMLTDSGVLAPGSLNGFLQGKYFNRCRLLHSILALALEILHFQEFMKTCSQSNDFSYSKLAVVVRSMHLSDVFTNCVEKYETYREETRSVTHETRKERINVLFNNALNTFYLKMHLTIWEEGATVITRNSGCLCHWWSVRPPYSPN